MVINGTIAWWVFKGDEAVTTSGQDSIFKMLLPMMAIEACVTSYFGLAGGRAELRRRRISLPEPRNSSWIPLALRYCCIQGAIGLSICLVAALIANVLMPTVVLKPQLVPMIVGLISGVLGFIFHSKAVIQAEHVFNRQT